MAGASVARNGLIPKKGELGNSCARLAIFQVSSFIAAAGWFPVDSPPALVAAAADPMSMSAASTRTDRKTSRVSETSRTLTVFHFLFGNAVRTNVRARSRGAKTTSVGSSAGSIAPALDTSFDKLEVRFTFDELPYDWIFGVLNLVDRSYLSDFPLVKHRDS